MQNNFGKLFWEIGMKNRNFGARILVRNFEEEFWEIVFGNNFGKYLVIYEKSWVFNLFFFFSLFIFIIYIYIVEIYIYIWGKLKPNIFLFY